MSELFPQLEPPPGGLFRLRRRLQAEKQEKKQASSSARRLRLWAPVTVAAFALVVVLVGRPVEPASSSSVLGAPLYVPAGGVVVDDVALPVQTLPGGSLFVWLPPT